MRRTIQIPAALAATLLAASAAFALSGTNGFTAAETFQWTDARAAMAYPTGFTGVQWHAMDGSGLGRLNPVGGQMAGTASGDLFYLAWGDDVVSADTAYSGLIHFDGTSHTHLVQDVWNLDTAGDGTNVPGGRRLEQVTVSPVTAGELTAGHPVAIRHVWNASTQAGYGEVLSVDPSSGAETSLYTWTSRWPVRVAIDDDGVVYALDGQDHTIRKLVWNASTSSYEESAVPTGLSAGLGMLIGPDGALYVGSSTQTWSMSDAARDVYRVDPATGASTAWARIQGRSDVHDWTFDSTGRLWVGLSTTKGRRGSHFVTEIEAGQTSSSGDAISSSSNRSYNLAASADGAVRVQEWIDVNGPDSPQDTVFTLSPGSGGGSGGGGGGGGGGKGKPKK